MTQLNGTSGHLLLLDRWDDLAGGSLVGGGAPSINRGRGRDRREGRNGHHRRDAEGGRSDRRKNGHSDAGHSEDRAEPRTERPAGREQNGGSPRPMNDPNPRSDRADPADGGWGDGR